MSQATEATTAGDNLYIRPARPSDAPAMARIAFLTADSGQSAEGKMNLEELPGLVFVLPYVTPLPEGGGRVKGATGFVLVERRSAVSSTSTGKEVASHGAGGPVEYEEVTAGYSLLAADSLAYRDATEKYWWPSLRPRFPLDLSDPENKSASKSESPSLTPLDKFFIDRIHHPKPFPLDCLVFSPAHMHINILPAYHGRGWGTQARRRRGRACPYGEG